MVLLFLENPEEHNVLVGKDICNIIFEKFQQETVLAKNPLQAFKELKTGKYSLVIIHHKSLKDINFLKERFPDLIYAAYGTKNSTMIISPFANQYRNSLLKHYDYFLYGLNCIEKLINKRG